MRFNPKAQPISPSLILGLIFLIGLAIRLYKLDFQSFWLDEYYDVIVAQNPKLFPFGFRGLPPVYIMILDGWLRLVPLSEVTARLPSAIIGALTIPLFYWLTKELFNKSTALLAAFFLAISAIHIDCSQEAKQYPLMFLVAVLMQLAYVRYLKHRKRDDLLLYGFFSVVGPYTHFYLIILFAMQNIHLALNFKKYKTAILSIFGAQAIAIGCFAIRAFLAFRDPIWIKGNLSWIPPLTPQFFHDTTISLFSAQYWNHPFRGMPWGHPHLSVFWYYALFATLIVLIVRARNKIKNSENSVSFVFLWLILPTLIVCFWSVYVYKTYELRYVIITILGLYLLYGWLIESEKNRALRAALIGLIVFINLSNLGFYFNNPVRAQFRQAAAQISREAKPTDIILVKGYKDEETLFNYYFKRAGEKNRVEFSENKEAFDPNKYDWIVAVWPNMIDTKKYPFSLKYLYSINLFHKK